jgi:type I restriction enzyme R subunit
MKSILFNESTLEAVALETFQSLGYDYLAGEQLERAPNEVVLFDRLRAALTNINPKAVPAALDEAFRKITTLATQSIFSDNKQISKWFSDGIDVEYAENGKIKSDHIKIFGHQTITKNDFLVVNQFTIIENNHNRRPDIIVFINGLPIAVLELKNPLDETATAEKAYTQLQNYKTAIPSIFRYNAALVASDGVAATLGSVTSNWSWFMPWRSEDKAPVRLNALDELIKGLFAPEVIIDYLQNFCLYENDGEKPVKKIAGYHQFQAVKKADIKTVEATKGDRRAGVIWHTQGSGKSLSMVFLARRLALNPALNNPTLVIITDRNDLDDQLFGTFGASAEFLRQVPVQVESREDLTGKLKTTAGGIIFTTIQKFTESSEPLSERSNIIVMADEAHRSQYDFIDGFARHMRDALPNASFIGFTGTPIEGTDVNTPAVFGDYIDIYDIQQAVEDGATVPIYYESRLAKLGFNKSILTDVDAEFDEITEGEEEHQKGKKANKWTQLEALVGDTKRVALVADDIVKHYKTRLETIDGKAMIVCMSRRICVDMYNEIVRIAPELKESIKIVMTGSSSDPEMYQPHIYSKSKRRELADEFRKPNTPFRIVIVRDMWLTGFDAPCLQTMYIDKPMQHHGLMQAIARVNRVYFDKKGGLIVDYIGLGENLKKALGTYTAGGGRGNTSIDIAEAVAVMQEKLEVIHGILQGFDYKQVVTMQDKDKLPFMMEMANFILGQEKGKERFMLAVMELSAAFSLCATTDAAKHIRDDVGLFQGVKSIISKSSASDKPGKTQEETEHAIKQLISRAVSGAEIVDILSAMGVNRQDVSILSEEFLQDVRKMEHKNLAAELLKKLIHNELKLRFRKNIMEYKKFSELLQNSFIRYQNRLITAAEVVAELIGIAKDVNASAGRAKELGLSNEEIAFYDALGANDSAVAVLGDEQLRDIARILTDRIRKNATIDWQTKDSVRARLRIEVKKVLRQYGYPPDKEKMAIDNVLAQAETIAQGNDW